MSLLLMVCPDSTEFSFPIANANEYYNMFNVDLSDSALHV